MSDPSAGALARARERLDRALEVIVLILMVALAVIVLLGVGFRKFGAALVWYDEVASVLLAWLTYYGASLAALRRAHIGMPTLVRAAPPRVRLGLVLLSEAFVLFFFMVVAWAGWRVLLVLEGTTLISLPWIPARLTQSVIPVGAVLFIVARLLSLPQALDPSSRGAEEGE